MIPNEHYDFICERGELFTLDYLPSDPTCPKCGQQAFLVERDDPPTLVKRPPWFHEFEKQPTEGECPMCGSKGTVDGLLPCACRYRK